MKASSRRTANGDGAPAKVILCAGLKSSGSTWLYNVVIRLLKEASPGAKMATFYADKVALFPRASGKARYLVVKSHIPSDPLLFVTRLTRGPIFLTIREPRDSVVSLMQRFRFTFDAALKDVAEEAARIAEFSRARDVILFRYEERFHEDPGTVAEIAALLGVRASKAVRQKIFASLTPRSVKRTITALQGRGAFGRVPKPEHFDPATHWHPGHVGDGRQGKYAEFLSASQQAEVIARTRDYCRRFGYLPRKR